MIGMMAIIYEYLLTICANSQIVHYHTLHQLLQLRGELRATINEELWEGVYVRERFISQSEHTPKYVY